MLAGLTDLASIELIVLALLTLLGIVIVRTVSSRIVIFSIANLAFLAITASDLRSLAVLGALLIVFWFGGVVSRKLAGRGAAPFIWFFVAFVGLMLIRDVFSWSNPRNPGELVRVVGLSYFVFRGVSFSFDAPRIENFTFIRFFCYMTFFPTLIAGPIERAHGFIDRKLSNNDKFEGADPLISINRIATGFVKKYVFADNLAPLGYFALNDPTSAAGGVIIFGLLVQLLVIYLDFSGYCDIVIGFAKLMGIELMENFERPLLARNLQEFWARWHISLTTYIQDYVFIPALRFSVERFGRSTFAGAAMALSVVSMILVALWHGFTLGFLVFGLLHGGQIALIQYGRSAKWLAIDGKSRRDAIFRAIRDWIGRIWTYFFVSMTLLLWSHGPLESLRIFGRVISS